jgi:hypothetical protein
MTLLAVGKAVAMVPCTPLKVAYLVGYYGYQYAVASKASAPAKIEEAAEEALARSLDVDGWQLVGGATEGEVIGLSERILRAADKVFVPCLEQTVVHSEEQLMSTEAEMPTQRRAVFCVFSNMLKSMYGSNAAQTVAEELSVRVRRFSGLFWPIFDFFAGVIYEVSILPPQKESKIGSKEPENRQNLGRQGTSAEQIG